MAEPPSAHDPHTGDEQPEAQRVPAQRPPRRPLPSPFPVITATLGLFFVVLTLLAIQVRNGRDPALGPGPVVPTPIQQAIWREDPTLAVRIHDERIDAGNRCRALRITLRTIRGRTVLNEVGHIRAGPLLLPHPTRRAFCARTTAYHRDRPRLGCKGFDDLRATTMPIRAPARSVPRAAYDARSCSRRRDRSRSRSNIRTRWIHRL